MKISEISGGKFLKMKIPNLVVSDGRGNVFDIPELEMVGLGGLEPVVPKPKDLIPLPDGSDLFDRR